MNPGIKILAGVVAVALAAGNIACSRESRKHNYLERADRLASERKYREAVVSYRQAIKLDVAFGEAHYRLALAELKLEDFDRAVLSLQRAALLMPDRMDVKAVLGQVYLDGYLNDPQRDKIGLTAVEAMANQLLAKDPGSFDGLRLKGRLALDQGDLPTAFDLLKRATAAKPLDPEATTALAEICQRQNRPDEARTLAEQLIQAHPDYGPGYDFLYRLHLARGRAAEAEQVLQRKLENNSKVLNYALQLAAHYAAVNKPAEMERLLQQILANPAQYPHGLLYVGEFYWMRFDNAAALKYFQEGERADASWKREYQQRQVNVLIAMGKAGDAERIVDAMLAADRKDRDIRRSKAGLLIQTRNPAKVLEGQEILQDLVREDPGDAASHFDLGQTYLSSGKLEQAKSEIREAIHLNRRLVAPRVAMAEISQNERRYQDALDMSAAAIELDGENFRARLLHAWALQGLGHVAQARQEIINLNRHFPHRADAQIAVARMEMSQGNFKPAEDTLLLMYKPVQGQGNASVLRELVTLYSAKGQPARGVALMAGELKTRPNSEDLLALYAMAAVLNGDPDLAIRQYEKLLTLAPSNGQYHVALSELQFNRGDFQAAVAHLQNAVAANPSKVEYMLLLGGVLSASGRPEDARQQYRSVLKLDPTNTGAMNNLAYNLADTGANLDEAYVLATQASQRDPSPDVLDTLGWVYLKKNMAESSIKIFDELVLRFPNNPLYRYHRGMALLQKGDRLKAKAELIAALAQRPSKRDEQKIRAALSN